MDRGQETCIKTSIYPMPPYFSAQNVHFRIHIILQHAFSYPRVQALLPWSFASAKSLSLYASVTWWWVRKRKVACYDHCMQKSNRVFCCILLQHVVIMHQMETHLQVPLRSHSVRCFEPCCTTALALLVRLNTPSSRKLVIKCSIVYVSRLFRMPSWW